MVLTVQVLVDGRDYTAWVESVSVRQAPRTYYREWSVTFRGLPDPVAVTAEVDILLGGQTVMVDGCLSPDRPPTLVMDGTVPVLSCHGYDWAWRAQRMTPRSTLVLAPSRTLARGAVEASKLTLGVLGFHEDAVVGRWEWVQAHTCREAVLALGTRAGLTVDYQLPDYTLAPVILDAQSTIWESMYSLIKCYTPEVYWRRERRALLLTDPLVRRLSGIGSLHLTTSAVQAVEALPTRRARVRRVIVRVPEFP